MNKVCGSGKCKTGCFIILIVYFLCDLLIGQNALIFSANKCFYSNHLGISEIYNINNHNNR